MGSIYLDQKPWIELSKARLNQAVSDRLKQVYKLLEKGTKEGTVKIPLSVVNVVETLKIGNLRRRKDVIETMRILCGGFAIKPYCDEIVQDREMMNAIFEALGQPILEMDDVVFGEGMFHIMGQQGTIIGEINSNKKAELLKKIDDVESLWKVMESTDTSGTEKNIKYITQLEANRTRLDEKIKDNLKRKDVEMALVLTGPLSNRFIKIATAMGYWGNPLFMSIFSSKKRLQKFFRQIPTEYVSFCLTYKRDRDQGDIEDNDLYDIAALSIAIPYCDVVVTEKAFGSRAIAEGLDKLYDTKIIRRTEDLIDCL